MTLDDPIIKERYVNTNETIDKWARIGHIILTKVSIPMACLPMIILTLFLVYTTDLGDDAYIVFNDLK